MILHPKASHFRIDFWSKFHACSKRLPKPLFSTLWPPKCTKKSPYWIFWVVFGAPSDFHGFPKSPNIAQEVPKSCARAPGVGTFWLPKADLHPKAPPKRSWAPFWSILDGFWMDFEWILMDFGIIFQGFWSRFCSSICRMPTPPGTKRNNRKRQDHAANCRNMQQSNATKKRINPNSNR